MRKGNDAFPVFYYACYPHTHDLANVLGGNNAFFLSYRRTYRLG